MNFRIFPLISALLLSAALSGCDTATQAVDGREAAVPPGKARLYFYRDAAYYDGLEWTTVSLNGEAVGASGPGTVFHRDIAPGTYRVEARSDKLYPAQVKMVAVAPGSTTYIKVEAQPYWGQSGWLWTGNTFIVAVIDPVIAHYQISTLHPTSG